MIVDVIINMAIQVVKLSGRQRHVLRTRIALIIFRGGGGSQRTLSAHRI